MSSDNNSSVELLNPNYVPVLKDSVTHYGGSQMWFPPTNRFSKDYILHNYGCGTIAAADLFLYLALKDESLRSPEVEIALQGTNSIMYDQYNSYIKKINKQYTKTHRVIAVLGPHLASAVNSYSKIYSLGYRASWKWSLSYYDMYAIIEEMLHHDIPVILSIGPNTPNLWGKKGVTFYQQFVTDKGNDTSEKQTVTSEKQIVTSKKPFVTPHYLYKEVMKNVNGHYVTVTGIIRDNSAGTVMLRISSWGKQYYINYEQYRDYIENTGGTYTSSVVYIKNYWRFQ